MPRLQLLRKQQRSAQPSKWTTEATMCQIHRCCSYSALLPGVLQAHSRLRACVVPLSSQAAIDTARNVAMYSHLSILCCPPYAASTFANSEENNQSCCQACSFLSIVLNAKETCNLLGLTSQVRPICNCIRASAWQRVGTWLRKRPLCLGLRSPQQQEVVLADVRRSAPGALWLKLQASR